MLSLCDIRFAYYLIIIRFHTFEEKFSSLSFVSDAKQNSIVNLHKIFMYRSQNPSLKACISNISEKKKQLNVKVKIIPTRIKIFFRPLLKEASNQYQKVLYDGTSESNIADVQKLPICFNNSGFVSSVRSSSGYHGLLEGSHFFRFFKFFRFESESESERTQHVL